MKLTKTIAGATLALALFAGSAAPTAAQATSAQIQALLAQVAALQEQIARLAETPTGVLFTSDMTIGSRGPDVSRLQSFLISRGYAIPAGATGYFGVETQEAVAAFQRANGINPPAGYFGSLTRARVNAVIGTPAPSPSTPSQTEQEEAMDRSEGPDEMTEEDEVEANAETVVVSGADNDYARFELTFTIRAFGEDIYIPTNGDDAFTFRVENASNGATITGSDNESVLINSSADEDNGYFRVEEGEEEEFTITMTFDPSPSDEAKSLRLQLLTLRFNDTKDPPDDSWNASPARDFRTPAAYVND